MIPPPARRPSGVPTGGQFARRVQHEPDLDLLADIAYLRSKLDLEPPLQRPDPDDVSDLTVTGAHLPDLVFSHRETYRPDRVQPITNDNHSKPNGGLWLSPGTIEGGCAWDRLLDGPAYAGGSVERSRRGRNRQQLALAPDARVLRIDSRADLIHASQVYVRPPSNEYGRFSAPPLDWEALSRDFDAVWVTSSGIHANNMCRDAHDDIHLYAWDVESVVVLRTDRVLQSPPAVGPAERTACHPSRPPRT